MLFFTDLIIWFLFVKYSVFFIIILLLLIFPNFKNQTIERYIEKNGIDKTNGLFAYIFDFLLLNIVVYVLIFITALLNNLTLNYMLYQ